MFGETRRLTKREERKREFFLPIMGQEQQFPRFFVSFLPVPSDTVLPRIFPALIIKNIPNRPLPFDFRQQYTEERKERVSGYLTCFLLSLESLLFRGCYIEFAQNSLFHAVVIKRTKGKTKGQHRQAFLPSLAASPAIAIVLHCAFLIHLEYKLFRVLASRRKDSAVEPFNSQRFSMLPD